MQPLANFNKKIKILFTDIDDTLTTDGKLVAEAYTAIWLLHRAGIKVIPVTGRPAGWCDMIARQWPIEGVIGENGGLYFRYVNKKMKRFFYQDEMEQLKNRKSLDLIGKEILENVPGSEISTDQFSRLLDLAIDISEDVSPIDQKGIDKIVNIFNSHGAQAKISSIHVNGWFGDYNKLSMAKKFLKDEIMLDEKEWEENCAFIGDSPNDEPMFEFFPITFGVANISHFTKKMKSLPMFIADYNGGLGFLQIAEKIINYSG